jgi:hypothetical protein
MMATQLDHSSLDLLWFVFSPFTAIETWMNGQHPAASKNLTNLFFFFLFAT